MTVRSRVRTHTYLPDPSVPADHTGAGYCQPPCGLPKHHTSHTTPDTSEHAAEDRRRLGDRED